MDIIGNITSSHLSVSVSSDIWNSSIGCKLPNMHFLYICYLLQTRNNYNRIQNRIWLTLWKMILTMLLALQWVARILTSWLVSPEVVNLEWIIENVPWIFFHYKDWKLQTIECLRMKTFLNILYYRKCNMKKQKNEMKLEFLLC